MIDPYSALGGQLLAAAHRRQAAPHHDASRRRRQRRLRVAVIALVLLLAGATIALAASGLLNGSAVEPRGSSNPAVGEGIPSPGGSRLLSLRASDPEGGPLWGMRIVRTTRGEVCVQIGRLHDGRLGELGVDGAFKDDGRFHPLPPTVLPTSGPDSSNSSCVPAGQTFSDAQTGLTAMPPRNRVSPGPRAICDPCHLDCSDRVRSTSPTVFEAGGEPAR